MAQTGRVGMIETTPADITTTPESGWGWWKKPAQTVTNAPAMVSTNWYDQVLGTAPTPTNSVPSDLNITAPASTGKVLDAGMARTYLQRAGGDKEKARAMARADGYTF
jgi:hypothetical protein